MLRNHALASMPAEDFRALRPSLTSRLVSSGDILTPQGALVETVYFPSTADLANIVTFADGRSAETFVMGMEGVSGLSPFLAERPCAWSVEAKTDGEVFALPATVLRARTQASPVLLKQLMKLASDYQAQSAIGVACSAVHLFSARLARSLLVRFERAETDRLKLTQQDLADLLGCQRTTVNDAAVELQAIGAIRYSRGLIRLVSAAKLRAAACECYELHRALMA